MSQFADDAADNERRHYFEDKEREAITKDREATIARIAALEAAVMWLLDDRERHYRRAASRRGEKYHRPGNLGEHVNAMLRVGAAKRQRRDSTPTDHDHDHDDIDGNVA